MSAGREPLLHQAEPLLHPTDGEILEKSSSSINAMVTKEQKSDIDVLCAKLCLTQTELLNSIMMRFGEFVSQYGWKASQEYTQLDREDATIQISAKVRPEAYQVITDVQRLYPAMTIRVIVGRAINYYFRICATTFSKEYNSDAINEIKSALNVLSKYPEFSDLVSNGKDILKEIKYSNILEEIRSSEDREELIEYLRSKGESA